MDEPGALSPAPRYFSAWDYVVFAVMLLASALIGIFSAFSGERQRTADEFLLGNRKMHVVPVAASIAVSYVSAVSVIGTPAEIYLYGTMFSWTLVVLFTGNFLLCRLFLPIFFRIRVTSVYELIEMRFNRAVRLAVTFIFAAQLMTYMGIVIYTPGLALSAVTGFSLWTCIMSTGVVCIFYTTVGGMKAVLWTDTLQAVIMVVGVVAVIIKGTIEVGGVGKVWQIADDGNRIEFLDINPDPRVLYSVWSMMIGLTFYNTATGVNQIVVQRMLSCGSMDKAIQAVGLSIIVKLVLFALVIISGVVMYAYYVNCDPLTRGDVTSRDQLMPLMVMDLFADNPGVPGLFLSAVVSGSLSTLSSGINALAAVTAEGSVRKRWPNMGKRTYATIIKLLSLLYGVMAIAFAYVASLLSRGVTQLVVSIGGVSAGSLLGVFCLAVFTHRCNSKGAFAGCIFSFFFMLWIKIGAVIYPTTRGQNSLSIVGCESRNNSEPIFTDATNHYVTSPSATFDPGHVQARPAIADLYDVSFVYYTPMGCFLCVIVGMLVSGLTGFKDPTSVDILLKYNLTDALFCCLPEALKRWMRCGVGKIKYREEVDEKNLGKVQPSLDEHNEVYTKRNSMDIIPTQ